MFGLFKYLKARRSAKKALAEAERRRETSATDARVDRMLNDPPPRRHARPVIVGVASRSNTPRDEPDNTLRDFAIGYGTGVPLSGAGLVGAMLHHNNEARPASSEPVCEPPASHHDRSSDSCSSSSGSGYDSGSSSSSSYDSGSSSSSSSSFGD